MTVYTQYREYAAAPRDQPRIFATKGFVLRQMDGALKRGAEAVQLPRLASDLDRLDDRLLKDVGLRREHFPSGAIRIVRR